MQTSIYIKYLSFIDPERGEFGEIFPEVMIFHAGHTRVTMKYEIYSILPNHYTHPGYHEMRTHRRGSVHCLSPLDQHVVCFQEHFCR